VVRHWCAPTGRNDIQEVVGSAIAMRILFGLPLWAGISDSYHAVGTVAVLLIGRSGAVLLMIIDLTLPGVIITACDTFTFLLLHYFGVRKLEALFGAMIIVMAACFITQCTADVTAAYLILNEILTCEWCVPQSRLVGLTVLVSYEALSSHHYHLTAPFKLLGCWVPW